MFLIRWFLCYFVEQLHCQSDLRQSSNCVSKIVMFEPQADREPIFLRALSALFGCYSFVQNAHICRPQQPQQPPKSENKFSQKIVANSPIGNCGIRGLFLGSLDLEPEKSFQAFWGENPPRIQPTDLQLICAAFGSRTDVRWLHFQSILRLEDLDTSVQSWLLTSGYAPCVKKNGQNSLRGYGWYRQYHRFFSHSDINPTQSLRSCM